MENGIECVKLVLNKLVAIVNIIESVDERFLSKNAICEVYKLNEVLMDKVVILNESFISNEDKSKMVEDIINIRMIISGIMIKLGIW